MGVVGGLRRGLALAVDRIPQQDRCLRSHFVQGLGSIAHQVDYRDQTIVVFGNSAEVPLEVAFEGRHEDVHVGEFDVLLIDPEEFVGVCLSARPADAVEIEFFDDLLATEYFLIAA